MRTTGPSVRLALSCLVISLICMGCSGAHLYDASRHEMSKRAFERFEEADIGSVIAKEREAQGAILDRELLVVRQHVIAERDAILGLVIGARDGAGSWEVLDGELKARVESIVGDASNANAVLQAFVGINLREETLRTMAQGYRAFGPTRKDPALNPRVKRDLGAEAFQQPGKFNKFSKYGEYVAELKRLDQERRDLAGARGGMLAAVESELEDARSDRKLAEQQISTKRQAFSDAKKAYEEKKLSGGTKEEIQTALDAVKARLDDLGEEVAGVTGPLRGFGLAGRVEKLEALQENLTYVLDAMAGGEIEAGDIAPGLERPLKVLSAIATLASELADGLQVPQVASLLLEKEHIRLELAALRTKVRRSEAWMALLEERANGLADELQWLMKAHQVLSLVEASARAASGKTALADVFADKNTTMLVRERIAAGLVQFANAYTLGRTASREAEYRLLALRHTMALDATETALAQWQNLIQVPLSRLVAYYAAGIRHEDIGQLLGVLGIWATAVGVN